MSTTTSAMSMSQVSWLRLLAGGLLATVFCFVTDGMMHQLLLDADWKAVYAALGAQSPSHSSHGMDLVSFFDFELGRGLGGVFLYVMMRPRLGPGPKTAAWAGLASWLLSSISGPAQFIPLGFFSHTLWFKAAAAQLLPSLAATIAGAAVYKEAEAPSPAYSSAA
jgi:hypothetical protein